MTSAVRFHADVHTHTNVTCARKCKCHIFTHMYMSQVHVPLGKGAAEEQPVCEVVQRVRCQVEQPVHVHAWMCGYACVDAWMRECVGA